MKSEANANCFEAGVKKKTEIENAILEAETLLSAGGMAWRSIVHQRTHERMQNLSPGKLGQ